MKELKIPITITTRDGRKYGALAVAPIDDAEMNDVVSISWFAGIKHNQSAGGDDEGD